VHEIKYDGYRLLALVEAGRARLLTRHGGDWTARFPTVAEALAALPVERAVVDGEVAVLDAHGVPDFQALQNSLRGGRGAGHVYFAFDLLHCEGHDLSGVRLAERKELLQSLLSAAARSATPRAVLRYSDHVAGDGRVFLRQACELGLEGSVSKRADAPYVERRARTWLKAKCTGRQEFVVGGWSDPAGARAHLGALVLGVYDDEQRLRYAGRVGAGFSDRSLAELARVLGPLATDQSPFVDPPRGAAARDIHYVRPERVVEVAFTGWTSDGLLRHPVFKGLREDKSPREIHRERARAPPGRGARRHR
jgi:bifunctional non-homologous end joining protein LigD